MSQRPGMSDSRCFTSYISSCQFNENIQNMNKLNTDAEYRVFLQKNAEKIMNSFTTVCSNQASLVNPNHKFKD